MGASRQHINEACEASLKRLDCEYVDLLQLHGYDELAPVVAPHPDPRLPENISALRAYPGRARSKRRLAPS